MPQLENTGDPKPNGARAARASWLIAAFLVVAPLVIPLGRAYGVDPVHLGIIFLANLELGYLTPPVGINLFLASYRFNEPVTRVYRQIVPFLLVQLAAVLLITSTSASRLKSF